MAIALPGQTIIFSIVSASQFKAATGPPGSILALGVYLSRTSMFPSRKPDALVYDGSTLTPIANATLDSNGRVNGFPFVPDVSGFYTFTTPTTLSFEVGQRLNRTLSDPDVMVAIYVCGGVVVSDPPPEIRASKPFNLVLCRDSGVKGALRGLIGTDGLTMVSAWTSLQNAWNSAASSPATQANLDSAVLQLQAQGWNTP